MALVHSEKYGGESPGWIPQRLLPWLINWLQGWCRAAADRCYLAGLNDYNLRDVGLSRHDVDPDALSRRRFW